MGLVCGVGVYEKGEYPAYVNRKATKEYELWQSMLKRCYSNKVHARSPSYIGCVTSENFKNFQFFAHWCQSQIGFNLGGYHLDKDIIFKGNKLYSEETCFFIPVQVNNFLTKSESSRGNDPIGVYFSKSRGVYRAMVSSGTGTNKHLGHYTTPEEAFLTYKIYKESQAKQLAKEYEGLVHPKVIEALNNYVVEITD